MNGLMYIKFDNLFRQFVASQAPEKNENPNHKGQRLKMSCLVSTIARWQKTRYSGGFIISTVQPKKFDERPVSMKRSSQLLQ